MEPRSTLAQQQDDRAKEEMLDVGVRRKKGYNLESGQSKTRANQHALLCPDLLSVNAGMPLGLASYLEI